MVDSCLHSHHRSMTVIMIHCCSIWIITNLSITSRSKRIRPSSPAATPFWRVQSASSSSRWPKMWRTSRSGLICRRWSTSRKCTKRWACTSPSANRPTRCTFSTTPTSTQPSRSSKSSSGTTSRRILQKLCKESTTGTSTPSTTSCSGSSSCGKTERTS